MTAADTVAMAWANLARRKGRTILTAAGVLIGVAALVLMVSLGLGLQRWVTQMFETDESMRVLTVRRVNRDAAKEKGGSGFSFGLDEQMIPLSDKDLDDIRALPGVSSARPELNLFLRVTVDERPRRVVYPVEGILPDEEARYAKHIVAGSMWSKRTEKVCLLPTVFLEMAKIDMKPADAIGRKITFAGFLQDDSGSPEEDAYTVAGVIDTEAFGFKGRQIYLPMDLALSLRERKAAHPLLPSKKGSYLSAEVRLADPREAEPVAKRLRAMGFITLSATEILKQINIVFMLLKGLMASIGAVGILVSLFGIANTMAMAVLERTREIGIMKALGARNAEIGRLFLAEAGSIGFLGGTIGLLVGTLTGSFMNFIAHKAFDVPAEHSLFYVSSWLAGGSVVFSMFVSVLAGWLPARRAARMEPVAAVRYE